MTSKLPHDVQHSYPVIEYGAADGWNPPRWDEEADTFIDRDEVSDPLEIATDESEEDPLIPQTPGPQSDFYMRTFERVDNEFNAPGENPYRDDGGLYRSGADMTLRKRLIRLAHEKPELRPKLLPILKEAAYRFDLRRYVQSDGDCPYCGTPDPEPVSEAGGAGSVIEVFFCDNCKGTWQAAFDLDRLNPLRKPRGPLKVPAKPGYPLAQKTANKRGFDKESLVIENPAKFLKGLDDAIKTNQEILDKGGLDPKWEKALKKQIESHRAMRRELKSKRASVKTARVPHLTLTERDYFSGGKGHGRHVLKAWQVGEIPAWGHFQGLMAWLRKIEALKEDPSWGSDEESLRDLKGLISKMDAYEKEVFPHGKPKKVRPKKQTRMGLFTEFMESSEGRKIRDLAKKLARNFDDIGAAGAFLEQVAEDANFRGGWKAVGRVVPSTSAAVTGMNPQEVARKLRWEIESVAAFSVALVASLGKAAMAKKLMKAFLAEEDFLFEVTT
jgi:hypothetical protein